MNGADPRELDDRDLLAYLLLGDLPRRGWPGRGRAIAIRMLLEVVGGAFLLIGAVAVFCVYVLTLAPR